MSVRIFFFLLSLSLQFYSSNAVDYGWCPDAVCKDAATCRPCDQRFLFIIAQGRSGSTTLKNMVNMLPGVRLNGEMGDVISKMQDLYSYIYTHKDLERGSGNMKGPWGHNPYNNELSCAAQKVIQALNPPPNVGDVGKASHIFGFKEIRVADLKGLKYLYTHFPCSRFVFNIRSEGEAFQKSQELYLQDEKLYRNSRAIPRLYTIMKNLLGEERVYLMDMALWKDEETGSEYFNALGKWLGFENCTFPKVLHDNAVVNNKWISDEERFKFDSSCYYKGSK